MKTEQQTLEDFNKFISMIANSNVKYLSDAGFAYVDGLRTTNSSVDMINKKEYDKRVSEKSKLNAEIKKLKEENNNLKNRINYLNKKKRFFFF